MATRRLAPTLALACLCLSACAEQRGSPETGSTQLPSAAPTPPQANATNGSAPAPQDPTEPPDPAATTDAGQKLPQVRVSSLDSRMQPILKAVKPDRAFADITTLARTPRHPKANPEQTRAAAAYIRSELTRAGLAVHEIPVESDGVTLPVVWAQIDGKRCSDKVFVLTGHYDTVRDSPGADDDASGVAGMLETARVLATSEPDASIVVAGLPFEEQGPPYPASRALADHLKSEGRTIVGMLSAEMLGYAALEPARDDPGNTLLLLGYQGSEGLVATFHAAAKQWTTPHARWGGVEAGTFPEGTEFISRSDHAAFHDASVPAAFATDGANFRTPHYHQRSDTPATIVRPFFDGAVRTIASGTFAMASLDANGDGTPEACSGKQPG